MKPIKPKSQAPEKGKKIERRKRKEKPQKKKEGPGLTRQFVSNAASVGGFALRTAINVASVLLQAPITERQVDEAPGTRDKPKFLDDSSPAQIGPDIPDNNFSKSFSSAYNAKVYEKQSDNWALIFNKLNEIFGDFDQKRYEEKPITFFSDLLSNEKTASKFNKIISEDPDLKAAWDAIRNEQTIFFEELVDQHFSSDSKYEEEVLRFDELNEIKKNIDNQVSTKNWKDFEKEYAKLLAYFSEKKLAFFNGFETEYWAEDYGFRHSLEQIQNKKERIQIQQNVKDLVNVLKTEYEAGKDPDFKNAVNYINQGEIILKILFNFRSHKDDQVAPVPSPEVNWLHLEDCAQSEDFYTDQPKARKPLMGVLSFAIANPLFYSTALVWRDFAEGLGNIPPSPVIQNFYFDSPEYNEATKYIKDRYVQIQEQIINEQTPAYNQAWNSLFNQINEDILKGKSYDEVRTKYGPICEKDFGANFDLLFGFVKEFITHELEDLKSIQQTKEFQEKITTMRRAGFGEEFKKSFATKWEIELRKDPTLKKSEAFIRATKNVEARTRKKTISKIISDPSIRDFYKQDNALRIRYEKILNEAKLYDYGEGEIEVAKFVVHMFLSVFKTHSDSGSLDMKTWKILVAREPMLAKAEALLYQEQYDLLKTEFRRKELLRKRQNDDLTPDEVLELDNAQSSLAFFKDVFMNFLVSMTPWYQAEKRPMKRPKEPSKSGKGFVHATELAASMLSTKLTEGPSSLRSQGNDLHINVLPNILEAGEMLSWVAKSAGGSKGKKVGELISHYAQKLHEGIGDFYHEVEEGATNYTEKGQWNIDKNRYMVEEFKPKEETNWVKKGLRLIVSKPEVLKSKSRVAWLANYAKAATGGAIVGMVGNAVTGRSVTVGTAVSGAVAGIAVEKWKGQLKAGVAFGIPGALVVTGIAIGLIGVGAAGGILIFGIAAVLFGIFGVFVMYHTKIGKNMRDNIANFVYSDELEYFKQWHEKIKRLDLGRTWSEKAAKLAEERAGQMYLRTEIAQDPRYKNLMQISKILYPRTREVFLEQVRRHPNVLSAPNEFPKLLAGIQGIHVPEKIMKNLIATYREKSGDTLKVGLNRRYENLKQELVKLDNDLPNIMEELEGKAGEDILKYDDKLKELLLDYGVDEEVIGTVFAEVNKKHPGEESKEIGRRLAHAVHNLGKLRQGVGEIPGRLSTRITTFFSADSGQAAQKAKEKHLKSLMKRDAPFVVVVLVLREIVKQRDVLMDEGALKSLLIDLNFDPEYVDALYAKFDEKNLPLEPESIKARIEADRLAMESALLTQSIIQEGISNGDLQTTLSNAEITKIENTLPTEARAQAMLNKDKDIDIPKKIPTDRALLKQFGLLKNRSTTSPNGSLKFVSLGVAELSLADQLEFQRQKNAYIANFEKMRIGMKIEKIRKAEIEKLLNEKKQFYVNKKLKTMTKQDKEKRINEIAANISQLYTPDEALYQPGEVTPGTTQTPPETVPHEPESTVIPESPDNKGKNPLKKE